MKKNIGFIPLDSSLAAWLLEKLTKEPPISDSAEELRSGIRDLLPSSLRRLLISLTDRVSWSWSLSTSKK